jgi:hypothetical protein
MQGSTPGIRKRLLPTPAERVPHDLVQTVVSFCEPIGEIKAAFVGVVEVTPEFQYSHEELAVAFELAEPAAGTAEGNREAHLVADRFYDELPESITAGGCNLLEPGAFSAWHEHAQQVFSR